jgi:CubicO group peptidase (beta-lactamase class C family)
VNGVGIEEYWPAPTWRTATPEAVGWSPTGLAVVDAIADEIGTAALMVVEGGFVVHQKGAVAHRYMCHSIRKSLLSALFGIYVAEGRIDLSSTLAALGIDDKEGLTDRERLASVNSLLMARSGVFHPTGYESAGMIATREARHSHGPGARSGATTTGTSTRSARYSSNAPAFACSTPFATGSPSLAAWKTSATGRTRRMATTWSLRRVSTAPTRSASQRGIWRGLGCFYLRGGRWGSRQVVPEKWVKLSVQPYSHAGASGDYGYMWWVVRDGIHFPGAIMPSGYSAQGAGGHVMMVLPEQDLVLVHRVDTDAGRAVSE